MATNTKKISTLKKDKRNANKGTDRGRELVANSFKELGAGRSILVDKNMNIIAGNHSLDGALQAGIKDAIVVPSDGKVLVVVQRTDVDINSATGRKLALADNMTAKQNIDFDEDVVQELADEFEIDLQPLGFDFDLGNGPDFGDDYDEDDPSEAMETGGGTGSGASATENIFPLAIVVTKAEKHAWEKLKKDCDLGSDTEAFKKLMAFAKHADVDFVRFIENRK